MSSHGLSALFGRLRHRLIQAPMAGVQDSRLALAVSRAGGLGSLPAALLDTAGLERELRVLQESLGRHGLPYNVNFFCHPTPAPCTKTENAWRSTLAPYYREWGLDPTQASAGGGRQPFNAALADVLAAAPPPVVSFHFGLPSPDLLARVKSWGALVLSSATTVEEGLWLQAHGADGVIAQGLEAGGHRGHFLKPDHDVSDHLLLMPLIKGLKEAVSLPIVAAGGLSDARAVRAALEAGADAVQVGTAFLLCDEALTPPLHRRALERAAADGPGEQGHGSRPGPTALTRLFTGRPARGLVNRLMRELDPMSPQAPAFPLAAGALAPLRSRAEAAGRDDFTPLWSGESPQGCRAAPAAVVLEGLMAPAPAPGAASRGLGTAERNTSA